jgi:hypothetical protein
MRRASIMIPKVLFPAYFRAGTREKRELIEARGVAIFASIRE